MRSVCRPITRRTTDRTASANFRARRNNRVACASSPSQPESPQRYQRDGHSTDRGAILDIHEGCTQPGLGEVGYGEYAFTSTGRR